MAYSKPLGYRTYIGVGASMYRPFNRFISGGIAYGPGAPSAQIANFAMSAVPANGSAVTVPDGPLNQPGTPLKTFTFTYSGSPGTGIIPLVAGGGTIAQAIVAMQTALEAQLVNWTVVTPATPSSGLIRLTSRLPGVTVGPGLGGSGPTNLTITTTQSVFASVLPGRAGSLSAVVSG